MHIVDSDSLTVEVLNLNTLNKQRETKLQKKP